MFLYPYNVRLKSYLMTHHCFKSLRSCPDIWPIIAAARSWRTNSEPRTAPEFTAVAPLHFVFIIHSWNMHIMKDDGREIHKFFLFFFLFVFLEEEQQLFVVFVCVCVFVFMCVWIWKLVITCSIYLLTFLTEDMDYSVWKDRKWSAVCQGEVPQWLNGWLVAKSLCLWLNHASSC